jgi:geranylgeranylglycerol-phosphate geranylgeranyltransferase
MSRLHGAALADCRQTAFQDIFCKRLLPLTLRGISIQSHMGYVRMIRPVNCMIALIAVYVGAWIGSPPVFSLQLLHGGIIAFLVCAFGNVVNDLRDIRIDKINNPHRPLASGSARKPLAIMLAVLLFFASGSASLSLGLYPSLLVNGALIILLAYAFYFKRTVVGNYVVALVSGLSFILGGILTHNPACLVPFVFSFFIHTPREILKDVMDMDGDRAGGVTSLPILLGVVPAYHISAFILCCLCILLPLPLLLNLLNTAYLACIVIGAYPLLIIVIVQLFRKPPRERVSRYSTVLKVVMVIGLIGMML